MLENRAVEFAAWPVHGALTSPDDRDQRARVGEAIKLFGVDLGQLARLEIADQMADPARATRSGVDPAAEGNQGVWRA